MGDFVVEFAGESRLCCDDFAEDTVAIVGESKRVISGRVYYRDCARVWDGVERFPGDSGIVLRVTHVG